MPDFITALLDRYTLLRGEWGVVIDIGAVILATVALDLLARLLFGWLYRHVRHSDNIWDDALFYSFTGPLQGLIWIIGISVAIHILQPDGSDGWLVYLPELRGIALVVVFSWFLFRLIRSVGANVLERAASRDNVIDATSADAVAKLMYVCVLLVAGIMLLQVFGVPLSALLAFSSIGGIALGFAARDMLANIFGGLTVYLNRPFSVGDWIRSPERDIEGVVEAIGWRATTVRRFDKRPLYVPNAIFSNVALENPSRMTHRRIMETVAVRYDDAALVPDIVQEIRRLLDEDKAIDSEQVILTYLDSLGESRLNLLIYCYTRTTDWAEYLAIKQSVLQRVQDTVRAHGAAIAFPTSTMHVPGELRVTHEYPADELEQEEIDPNKVQSERRWAVAREQRRSQKICGPDNPTEEG